MTATPWPKAICFFPNLTSNHLQSSDLSLYRVLSCYQSWKRRHMASTVRRANRTLRAYLDQVPLNYPSETVVQLSSTAHFHYGFPTVEPLSWYSNKLLSCNLKTATFQPCKRCHTP